MKRALLVPLLSVAALAAQGDDPRARIKAALFVPDPLPPLAAETHGRFEPAPGVVAEKVTYGTQYGMRVPAILYMPKSRAEKIPALIVVNGHGGDKYSWYAFWSGITYARAGAAVLTYDPAGEGERNAERKSGTRAHDAIERDPILGRRLGGIMMTDVMQAVSYLRQRPEVDAARIGAMGYSMGSFVLSLACATETRLHACVLAGGGNLDGPGAYWDTSKPMCQGFPYQSLQFLGDRPKVIYSLHAQRGPTLVINGLKDPILQPKRQEPRAFFEDLKRRVNMPGKVFDTEYDPDGAHRPYFVTRAAALWLERKLGFPNWTEASIRSMPVTHMSEWAKAKGVATDPGYISELSEGGAQAVGVDVPGFIRDEISVFSAAEWERRKDSMVLESWVKQAKAAARPATRWERSAKQKREQTEGVSWPSHEPLIFHLRRGTHSEDQAEIYERQHDPENLKRMAAAGVRHARLHFYKGFGLAYEKEDIEKTKRAAALMHQLGMKVSIYVAGTMFTEAFYREVPEAKNWEQRDQNGRPVPYMQTQTFRHYACPNEPAYREYLKKVLRIGVEEVKADQIFFDNVQLQPEPKSCRCERCMRAFHEFLHRRYPTREAALRRFGMPTDWLRVNEWDVYNTPDSVRALDDPVLQEWVRFRCEAMAKHYNELYDYIRSLNPKISVGYNLKGIYGFNRMWLNGIYHPFYSGKCDFTPYDVNGMESRLDSRTGALISEIRSYKMARRLDMSCDDSLRDELNAAVHMAFNYEKEVPGFGTQGGPFLQGGSNVFTPMAEFFREYNDRYFTRTDNVADVAVLRTWPSMAYSMSATLVPTILMEQVLIQHKVPFDLLYEEQIGRIGRYGAVILAGQESVSGAQVEKLLQYVRNGGTLVLTGDTAQYNEYRERRRSNPLLPARQEGKGRIIYIPQIIPARSLTAQSSDDENPEILAAADSRGNRFEAREWTLPSNHQQVFETVAGGLPKELSITTGAPLTTVMELLNRAETRETIAHFINFDREKPVAAFQTAVRKQFAGRVKSVTCFSPDADDPMPLAFQEAADRVNFTVPGMRLYSMVVIAYE